LSELPWEGKKHPKKGGFLTPQKGGVDPPSGGYPPKPVRGGPRRLGIGTFFGTPPARGVGDPKKGVGTSQKGSKMGHFWAFFGPFLSTATEGFNFLSGRFAFREGRVNFIYMSDRGRWPSKAQRSCLNEVAPRVSDLNEVAPRVSDLDEVVDE
jgi:hypothetical protein